MQSATTTVLYSGLLWEMWSLIINVGLLVFVLFLLSWCEKNKFLRGQGDGKFQAPVQKLLRCIFYFLLTSFFMFRFPLIYWVISIPYLYTYTDLSELNVGRKSAWFQSWRIWKLVKWYFSLKVVKTGEVGEGPFIIATSPHGILPFGGKRERERKQTVFFFYFFF